MPVLQPNDLRQRIKASQKALWSWQVSTEIGKVDGPMTEAICDAELGALGNAVRGSTP